MSLGLQYKVKTKTKNVSLTSCQRSEYLPETLLTQLVGQFIDRHNIQFFKRLENLV